MNHLSTKFYFLFSLAIILFFGINYTSNNPQVLGETNLPGLDSSGQPNMRTRTFVDRDGGIEITYFAIDGTWCKEFTDNDTADSAGCEDNTGQKTTSYCENGVARVAECYAPPRLATRFDISFITAKCPTSAKLVNKVCSSGTKCNNGTCPSQPFPYQSYQSTDNTWYIYGGLSCEDQTGKYLNYCKNNSSYSYGGQGRGSKGTNIPEDNDNSHCLERKVWNCTDIGRKCAPGGCIDPNITPQPTYPPYAQSNEPNSLNITDGTWCKILGDNTACQDSTGTYNNYCSGNVSVKYYCVHNKVTTASFNNVRCVSGDFPCATSCTNGICGTGNNSFPTPTPTTAPSESRICHWNSGSDNWNALDIFSTDIGHQNHEKDYPYTGPYDLKGQNKKLADIWCQDHMPNSDNSWCHELDNGSCQDATGTYQSSHPTTFRSKSINYDCVGTLLEDNTYSNVKCQSREECTPWLFLPSGYCNWPIITFFTGKKR
jgi:hypothetical protein